MSKKASTTAIGAFIIGAVLLALAGIGIFGTGTFFVKTFQYVIYFQESVKGLNIGAPVLFKGVKVGEVTDIIMEYDAKQMEFRIPVIIEITEGTTTVINEEFDKRYQRATHDDVVIDLVNQGLRAKLGTQNYITGLLYVNLDFFPEKESRIVGKEAMASNPSLIEIPSIPSDMEAFSRTFEDIPLKEIAWNLLDMTDSLHRIVSSPQIPGMLISLDDTLNTFKQTMAELKEQPALLAADLKMALRNTDRLVRNVNEQVEPVARGLIGTTDAAQSTLVQARETLSLKSGPGADLVADVKRVTESAAVALKQVDTTLKTIREISSKDSEVVYTLNTALDEIAMAARAIRTAADYLERHPESLLQGKGGTGGN